jgi:hypothetical protein
MLLLYIIHQIILYCILTQCFLAIRKYLMHHPETVLLMTMKTMDVLAVFWFGTNIVFWDHSMVWRVWDAFFCVLAIYRLAKNNYPDDDDDTKGKRLRSWAKSKLPKPYVKPIPVPV